ncbi:MAG TPA: hypothetical protein VIQ30_11945 [Pseudonocardia sp.]
MTGPSQPPCPPELRERAVRMVAEIQSGYDSPWAATNAVRRGSRRVDPLRAGEIATLEYVDLTNHH